MEEDKQAKPTWTPFHGLALVVAAVVLIIVVIIGGVVLIAVMDECFMNYTCDENTN